MVPGDYSILALLVLSCAAVIAGYASGYVANWGLRRRLYSLEFDIATLENKLLSEVKRRAGTESGKARKADQDLLEAAIAHKGAPQAAPQPWWLKYAQNPESRES